MRERRGFLFINYYFSPSPAVGALRNSKFAKYVALGGDEVTVLTTSNVRLNPGSDIIGRAVPGLTIALMPTFDYQTVKFLVSRRAGSRPVRNLGRGRRRLLDLLEIFPLSVILGEGGLIYAVGVFFKAFFLAAAGRCRAVYTSYSPFTDLYCGYLLKLIFPSLVWVADLRDYPLRDGMPGWIVRWNSFFYRRILGKADRLTAVSEGLAGYLSRFHDHPRVLRNAFDPDDIVSFPEDSGGTDRFTLVYAGSLYDGRRNPTLLFKALASCFDDSTLDRKLVRFCYAGRDGGLFASLAETEGVADIVEDAGLVGRDAALRLQSRASVLVMLTWVSGMEKGVLSSKFYEYLAWGKPVICLVNGGRDPEIEQIFSETSAGLVANGEDAASVSLLRRYLRDRYAEFREKKPILSRADEQTRNRHSYPVVAAQLAALLAGRD